MPTSPTVTRRIEDATPVHAGTDWKMAALSIAVAVGVVWWFQMPLSFDVNSPSFNPAVFVPVLLGLYGVTQAFSWMRGRNVGSRFGTSVFEMHGNAVSAGQTLRGRVITSRDLPAAGGFLVRLRCVEAVRYNDVGSSSARTQDKIRWEQERTVHSTGSGSAGVPVEFAIPLDSGARATGISAGAVRWLLEVEAAVAGARYRALFGVPVTAVPDQ